MRTATRDKGDLLYKRDRDAGRCTVGQFSPVHILVSAPDGTTRVEIIDGTQPPPWVMRSARMRAKEIERTIRRSSSISPQMKAVYLTMLDSIVCRAYVKTDGATGAIGWSRKEAR